MKIPPAVAELLHANGRTDMAELNSRFSRFCERVWKKLFSALSRFWMAVPNVRKFIKKILTFLKFIISVTGRTFSLLALGTKRTYLHHWLHITETHPSVLFDVHKCSERYWRTFFLALNLMKIASMSRGIPGTQTEWRSCGGRPRRLTKHTVSQTCRSATYLGTWDSHG